MSGGAFKGGDEVVIVACEDDPRAVGRTGRIVDEVPPGPLTDYRYTVTGIGVLIGPTLCKPSELQKVSADA